MVYVILTVYKIKLQAFHFLDEPTHSISRNCFMLASNSQLKWDTKCVPKRNVFAEEGASIDNSEYSLSQKYALVASIFLSKRGFNAN